MRITGVLASRHFTVYDRPLFAPAPESDGSAPERTGVRARIAYCVFACSLLLLLAYTTAHSLTAEDFSAYYCSGAAVRAQIDPYRAALHGCEENVIAALHRGFMPDQTLPAPFPPYALALFALYSLLPVPIAIAGWIALGIASYLYVLRRLHADVRIPYVIAIAATGIPMLQHALVLGQLTLPVFACMLYAGHAWRNGFPVRASVGALCTMLSPALGLPFCLALAIFERSARVPLCIGGLLIALVDVTVLPWRTSVEYFASILPAHALAELASDQQYSISHVLMLLHVPERIAVTAGSLWYAGMVAFAIAVASRIAKDPCRRAFALVFVPAAAMFGGGFVHIQELAIMPVATLMLYRASRQFPWRSIVAGCVIPCALPLGAMDANGVVVSAGFCVLLVQYFFRSRATMLVYCCCAWTLLCSGALGLLAERERYRPSDAHVRTLLHAAAVQGRSLEEMWRVYIGVRYAWQDWSAVILHLPLFAAAAATIYLTYYVTRSQEPAPSRVRVTALRRHES